MLEYIKKDVQKILRKIKQVAEMEDIKKFVCDIDERLKVCGEPARKNLLSLKARALLYQKALGGDVEAKIELGKKYLGQTG